jgi:thiamine transporter
MSTPLAPSAPDVRERLNLDPTHWSVRMLAEIGVAIALAAVLGQLRLFVMPQGGSLSLEMLPIIFVAIRRGVVPGLVAGFLYGCLQLALPGAFMVHPAQVVLDYCLAFAALGVAGFVPVRTLSLARLTNVRSWRALLFAVSLAVGARFVFHFLSGWIFFSSYAPGWEAPWLYSITYNLLYLVPEGVITVVLLVPLLAAYDAAFPGRGLG